MFIASFFMVVPIFFKNVWNTGYFPINSSKVFDNTGNQCKHRACNNLHSFNQLAPYPRLLSWPLTLP